MAKLTAEEIRDHTPDAVEVGVGIENGHITYKIHQGHIEEVVGEDVRRKKAAKVRKDPTNGK